MFLGKYVQKIFSKVTGQQPCRNVISIKLQSNFLEIALQQGYSLKQAETYLEPCQAFMIELFVKVVKNKKSLTTFEKKLQHI